MNQPQLKKAKIKLAILDGTPPFNAPHNVCKGSEAYARTLQHRYKMPVQKLRELVNERLGGNEIEPSG